MNEKALKELSPKDRSYMEDLLAKESEALTESERAHLVSRRGYLTKETQERYGIEGAEASGTGDASDSIEYETMTVKELTAMAVERGIELAEKAKKADIIEVLKADDAGELVTEEE